MFAFPLPSAQDTPPSGFQMASLLPYFGSVKCYCTREACLVVLQKIAALRSSVPFPSLPATPVNAWHVICLLSCLFIVSSAHGVSADLEQGLDFALGRLSVQPRARCLLGRRISVSGS